MGKNGNGHPNIIAIPTTINSSNNHGQIKNFTVEDRAWSVLNATTITSKKTFFKEMSFKKIEL